MIDLARHGDAPAIEEADGTVVTYAALLARARAYARGGVVRVPATRDTELVARCLGAWLGGGAFFPVEPCDPRPRPVIEHEPGLAYVIATSGSSGAPKHVLVGHRGIPALLAAQIDAFALGPGARALWLHAPLFDASISDWGTTLAAGATLVIPTAASLGSPARLNAELSTRAITHVDLPPSLLAHLEPPPSLRVVVLGGEPCDVQRVRSLARERRVVVVYGPTEATVCSSLVVVDPAAWERPMIGQPLPGVTYRVVDGELYIAGDALAFRYAEAAETARHFVVLDGMRWYRTGDRVDVTPQGLAYVGRVDRQCKVAGRRVELDEIEAALRAHVGEAAVVVKAERIIAYVERSVERAALQLPRWMLPVRIIVGPLPRTATGKLDRAALAARPLPPPVITFTEPREHALAVAWCRALGTDTVTRDDRFSAAGGDSLARLVLAIEAGLEIDGDPTFGELVEAAPPSPLIVAACEERGLARLAATDRPARRRASGGDGIFVTGATGVLGRHLLTALRRHHARPIIALVRDRDAPNCEQVRGDVAQPWLGIGEAAWHALRERVALVIHAAAVTRLGGDWDDHVDTNVGGTAEIARFAGADMPWHHVSTLSVFVNTDRAAGRHEETATPERDARVYGGYAQTKVAAEAIARAAGASVYRLGLLVDDDPSRIDQRAMTVRGLVKLGAVPAGMRTSRFDTTEVTFAADAIARLARRCVTDTHHIASARGKTCGELADELALVELPLPVWRERARARSHDVDIAMAIGAFSGRPALDLFLATDADFAVERTEALLR